MYRRATAPAVPHPRLSDRPLRQTSGFKNGRLLEAAEEAGFDVLITVDQNNPDQQNMSGRKIALVILRGSTNRLRDLTLLVPAAISAISSIAAGDVVRIG
jgi:hypothetical protein